MHKVIEMIAVLLIALAAVVSAVLATVVCYDIIRAAICYGVVD